MTFDAGSVPRAGAGTFPGAPPDMPARRARTPAPPSERDAGDRADLVVDDATAAAEALAPAVTSQWRREHAGSGLTSGLILKYVEREAGGQAVKRMLARADLIGAEERLRDENSWFSYETKLALWSAAAEELGDPQVAEHIGSAVLDLSVASGLKRALRALGSPGFVYGNVVRANAKFNWAHELVVLESSKESVRIRYVDLAGVGYHHYDCEYTKGLLATVPQLFGLPPAHVSEVSCGARGGVFCEFDVRWSTGTQGFKRAGLAIAAASGALAGAGLAQPELLPAAAGIFVLGELGLLARGMRFMRCRLSLLEKHAREQEEAAERLLSSLEALSSDLRLDEVLDQITAKAQTAVGGKEFALLLADGEGMRVNRHSGISGASLAALERWAQERRPALLARGVIVLDDLATEPTLATLPHQAGTPIGSMCVAPLVFRDELLGVLVAMARGTTVFLPGDSAALCAYAAHAAMALSNARLVSRLERQAAEDPLTGLANQRAFRHACAAELSRMGRVGGQASIVMLDLDKFKSINDIHGHPYGDQVLIDVAGALRESIREHDVAARMGGEEFAILLPDTDPAGALEITERARDAISRIPGAHLTLSCSAGVASGSLAEGSPAGLLELADEALYEAKRLGRDRTVMSAGEELINR